MVAFGGSVMTGIVIIYSAVISSLQIGTLSVRKGKLFAFIALTYILWLKISPTAKLTNKAKIMGKNKLTFSVVSNIITANENERRE